MNCEEAREAFSDLYDGTLSGPPLATLSQHLDGCPACTAEWGAFRRAMLALKDLGGEEPSPGFAARVADRIAVPPWWRRALMALVFPLRVKAPLHAAALAMLCLVGLWMFQRSPEFQKATDLRPPMPTARPAVVTPPPTPVTPPSSTQDAAPAHRPPEVPTQTRASQGPPPAPARSSEDKGEAPAVAREPESATQVPAGLGSGPKSTAPLPAAPGTRAESEMPAPRVLRSAQTPLGSRERAEAPAPTAPGAAATVGSASTKSRGTSDEIFSAAATEFEARRYEAAINDLRDFLAQYPDDGRAPDARFLLADAYRAQGRHAEASAEFEAFLRQYPGHPKAPVALYRQGESRLLLGDRSGCGILRDALSRYPDTHEAPSAREMLTARCP